MGAEWGEGVWESDHSLLRAGVDFAVGEGGLWAVSKVDKSVHARASLSEVYPAGKLR